MAMSPSMDKPLSLDFEAVLDQEELTDSIEQMMFVSGETGEPSAETTTLIEQIVQSQVHEMVSMNCRALLLAFVLTMQLSFANVLA